MGCLLIFGDGDIIDTTDVTPIVVVGEVLEVQILVRESISHQVRARAVNLFDASIGQGKQADGQHDKNQGGLHSLVG